VLGGFREALDQQARPHRAPLRARVQARQIFVFATAGTLGWNGPWESAVRQGLSFFLTRYRRPDGLFRTLLTPEGEPADDSARLYDQAFALLAFAAAAKALPRESVELKSYASQILSSLEKTRRHSNGGFREWGGPSPFLSNPHMHLLEAALAWVELDGGDEWIYLADEIVYLCLGRLLDCNGAIREVYDGRWRPFPTNDGRVIEPGHQFEWAWLISRWASGNGTENINAATRRLYEIGLTGVDWNRRVVIDALLDNGTVWRAGARMWPQTEWLKASLALNCFGDIESAFDAVFKYLRTDTFGLWRDNLSLEGDFAYEPAPASTLYHIMCAFSQVKSLQIRPDGRVFSFSFS
jgi:mannose-6-phosphate isomerase